MLGSSDAGRKLDSDLTTALHPDTPWDMGAGKAPGQSVWLGKEMFLQANFQQPLAV